MISADTVGAILESRPRVLGCGRQSDLTAKGKGVDPVVADGECTG